MTPFMNDIQERLKSVDEEQKKASENLNRLIEEKQKLLFESRKTERIDKKIAELRKHVNDLDLLRKGLKEKIREEQKKAWAIEIMKLRKEADGLTKEFKKSYRRIVELLKKLELEVNRFDELIKRRKWIRSRSTTLSNTPITVTTPINPDHVSLWSLRRFLRSSDFINLKQVAVEK